MDRPKSLSPPGLEAISVGVFRSSPAKQEISITIDSDLLQEVDRLTDDRSAAIEEGLQLWRQKQNRIHHFFETVDKLAAANDIDPISEEEIQAEIESYRSSKQSR